MEKTILRSNCIHGTSDQILIRLSTDLYSSQLINICVHVSCLIRLFLDTYQNTIKILLNLILKHPRLIIDLQYNTYG